MQFPDNEALAAAIPLRHSVRAYEPQPLPAGIVECLRAEIEKINAARGTAFRLVTDEPRSFQNFFARYGKFSNVVNYIIVAAPKGDEYSRICGFEGERLVLGAQALGLNTCWVGLSFSKNSDVFRMPPQQKIRCVIALGYGRTQGVPHKTRTLTELSNLTPECPEAFRRGVEAARLAPTAVNQQKFYFTLEGDGSVKARAKFSLVGYTQIDLGIAACNFRLASGLNVDF